VSVTRSWLSGDADNGRFLLVHFHIEQLCHCTTLREVRQELANIKNDQGQAGPLDPTYDRSIESLKRQSPNEVQLALSVLSWITKARRTLTVDELRVAVSVERLEPGEYKLDDQEDLPKPSILTDVCVGLVVIDDISNTIRLAHNTENT
jgi:hypothetical protein